MFLTFLSFVAYMHLCLGEGIFLKLWKKLSVLCGMPYINGMGNGK